MNLQPVVQHRFFRPVVGAGLAALFGLFLWHSPPGEPWRNASFDYQLRFISRGVTNHVMVVYLKDLPATASDGEASKRPRSRPTRLLERLTADGCRLAVLDIYLGVPRDAAGDAALAEAIRRNGRVVLGAKLQDWQDREVRVVQPLLPLELFKDAAGGTNWGVTKTDEDVKDKIVRQHHPFPSPSPPPSLNYESLPWRAARMAGATLSEEPEKRWIRYYDEDRSWTRLSYAAALTQAPNYFSNAVVFIGRQPNTFVPDIEEDKFQISSTRWTGDAVAGVDVMTTIFLNLLNGEWLRRPAAGLEALIVLLCAVLVGAGLCLVRPWLSCTLAAVAAVGTTLGGATLCQVTDYWFPWLVVAGGQVPVALAWAWSTRRWVWPAYGTTVIVRKPDGKPSGTGGPDEPYVHDFEFVAPPFGEGHFGKVWLVRSAAGHWQALKKVARAKFGQDSAPYDTEFRGIQRYMPVSGRHPGLLQVHFISRHEAEGYFYYVMELADSLEPGWEKDPRLYRPADLLRVCKESPGERLPPARCIEIGVALADALAFLHGRGLTHRDIKPGNVVFVDGRPKLADVGLVGEARPPEQVTTIAGTPGYMPPWPEPPGTIAADIYGLGMLLYVISTGQKPVEFSTLNTAVMEGSQTPLFMRLNGVILRACQLRSENRFASAASLRDALLEIMPRPNA